MILKKLTQKQNEALIGLLILVYRADNKISLSEQEFLSKVGKRLHWDSPTDIDGYCAKAVAQIRGDNKDSIALEWVSSLQPVKNELTGIFSHMASVDGDFSLDEKFLLEQFNLTK